MNVIRPVVMSDFDFQKNGGATKKPNSGICGSSGLPCMTQKNVGLFDSASNY